MEKDSFSSFEVGVMSYNSPANTENDLFQLIFSVPNSKF